VFLDLSNSIGNSRCRREVISAGAPRKPVIRASKCEVYCVVIAPNCHFGRMRVQTVRKNSPALKSKKEATRSSSTGSSNNSQKPSGSGSVKCGPPAMSCPICADCGVNIDESVQALQCDRCCDDASWKCSECLGLNVDVYEALLSNSGRELRWFCTPCSKQVMSQRDSVNEKLDDISKKLENLVDRLHYIEVRLDSKADARDVSKLEVQIDSFDKRMTSIEAAVQSATVGKKPDEEMVKDYVEKVLETKNFYDKEEKAERDRRKTSVIIHGVKESDCDLPKDREDEDLGVMAAMSHEMSCNDVTVSKVIRLGKRSTDESSDAKPRPIKMVVESEEQKVKIICSAKNLRLPEEGGWKNIFVYPDVTLKERAERQKLLLEMKRRRENGETGLLLIGNKIVKRFMAANH